ncbi:MAG: hypothetical protein ETSY2_39070 [Candidatus Entotheonella gemina]|uniref:Uncharacterized protein n=1 Tax=Candidatus Entotheonella gemina TaxID=1429439 RepID=W4LR45_9BACT|nr:MAG: hypothetical protein ETSY2_39070 [Candidatus Entotheonella gemina]
MGQSCLSLAENFLQYFDVMFALTPEQKQDGVPFF